MDDGIFVPNSNKKVVKETIISGDFDRVFCMNGMEDDHIDEAPVLAKYRGTNGRIYKPEERYEAAARSVKNGTTTSYWIKKDSYGEIFDPKNTNHLENSLRKFNGIPIFSMVKVSKAQFDHYLAYLKTGNKFHLGQAKKVY